MATDIGTLEYQVTALLAQVESLLTALNETRSKLGLAAIQIPRPARGVRVHQG